MRVLPAWAQLQRVRPLRQERRLLLIGPCVFGKANDALLDDVILVLLARRITEGIDDDDGDVVETAGDNRLLDQRIAGVGGSGIIEQDFLDVLIGDHGA